MSLSSWRVPLPLIEVQKRGSRNDRVASSRLRCARPYALQQPGQQQLGPQHSPSHIANNQLAFFLFLLSEGYGIRAELQGY